MSRIPPIHRDNASPHAAALLAEIRTLWGGDWNTANGMANAPSVLEGFIAFWKGLRDSDLSNADREVISLEMARHNGCRYCLAAHRYSAAHGGLTVTEVEALTTGGDLAPLTRVGIMQRLVQHLLKTRGRLSDEEFNEFATLGVTTPQMVAAVAEIGLCTFANFFGRLAEPDLDHRLVENERPRSLV